MDEKIPLAIAAIALIVAIVLPLYMMTTINALQADLSAAATDISDLEVLAGQLADEIEDLGGKIPVPLTQDRLVPELVYVFNSIADDPVRYEFGLTLIKALEALGVRVTPKFWTGSSEFNAFVMGEPALNNEWNMFTVSFVGREVRLDPDALLGQWHTDASWNKDSVGWSNATYDATLAEARAALDVAERQEKIYRLQEIIRENNPVMNPFYYQGIYVYNTNYIAEIDIPTGISLNNFWSVTSIVPGPEYVDTINFPYIGDLLPASVMQQTSYTMMDWLTFIYDPLARIGPDIEPVPWAAESWEVISDTEIEVTLRPGQMWHDGEDFTVGDVVFTYEYMIEHQPAFFHPYVDPIESVTAIDADTVRFTTTEPYSSIVGATFALVPILPEHIWSTIDDPINYVATVDDLIGSGVMTVVQWTPDACLFQRNPDHWLQIDFEYYSVTSMASAEALFNAFLAQEVHTSGREDIRALQLEQLAGYDWAAHMLVDSITAPMVGMNNRFAPFDDLAFRQAMLYCVDVNYVTDVILAGYGGPGGYAFIAPANAFWNNPDIPPLYYDLDKARQILGDAGYEWGPDGRLYMPA
jgi:peptide/nickel transport system substrate-binding protein